MSTKIKVLAIDDDPAMTELLALLLKTNDLDVITANNGPGGIQLIKEVSPDIVLLDMMMPDMDGREVCREIRTFSNVPIVVLSALNNPGVVASALDEGADDYLIKPVPSSILVAHIRSLARRSGTGALNPNSASLQNLTMYS